MTALRLNLDSVIELTDEQFYQLCQTNPDIKFERTATGELIVMPPTGQRTGNRNSKLKPLQDKMQEYLKNGVLLGQLIDPQNLRVEIYPQGKEVEVLQSPTNLSGEDVLPNFVLDLSQIL